MKCGTRIAKCGVAKKSILITTLALVGFGISATSNAGTEVIRDYGPREPAYNYAPAPPPRPIYYAPPPPVGVVVYPRPLFFGFGFHHRYYPDRVFVRRHFWRAGR